ncbi:DNA cytosine methyltransferase [Planctomycetota bacterium]
MRGEKIGIVSLFAGCGGLDLGFTGGFVYRGERYRKLPFQILRAYDNDRRCIETYRRNIGEHLEDRDLSTYDFEDAPSADVLLAGFPCQDFSSCGPRMGLASERGRLYRSMVRYMERHQPSLVVGENVPYLEALGKGAVIQTILSDLRAADPGYDFVVWRLYGPDYGIPQTRTRLFLVGTRRDIATRPCEPNPTHDESSYRSIDWAIEDLAHIEDESVPNQSQYFRATRARKGNGQGDETNKAGRPSYTIRANCKSRVQFHYRLDRRLTVRECARLQTFPDTFVFPHSATANMLQIGNAVPPVLAHHVASACLRFFLEALALPQPKTRDGRPS